MREIEIQELSLEAFRYYGSYHDLLDQSALRQGARRSNEFYPDLCLLNLGKDLPVAASVARVDRCDPVIEFAEVHKRTGEGILPLDGDIIIFVAKPSFRIDSAGIEAFRVPRGTVVSINPGVLHGRQYVCGCDAANVLILLPERTYANDCEFVKFEGEDIVRILGV